MTLTQYVEFRSSGGRVLHADLVREIFAFDDDADETRAACVGKSWDEVRRGPAWIVKRPRLSRGATVHISCVAYSPDGSTLAVGGEEDHKVVFYDASTGQLLSELVCEGLSCVDAVQYTPRRGVILAVGGENTAGDAGYIGLYDATTKDLAREFHRCDVSYLAFSPNVDYLAAAGFSEVSILGWVSGRVLHIDPHEEFDIGEDDLPPTVYGVAWCDAENVAVCRDVGIGACVAVYSIITGVRRLIHTVGFSVAVGAGTFAVGQSDGFTLYDSSTLERRRGWERNDAVITAAFSLDGSLLAVGCCVSTAQTCEQQHTKLAVYEIAGEPLWEKDTDSPVRAIAWSPDGATLAATNYYDTVTAYNSATGERRKRKPVVHKPTARWFSCTIL